MPAWMCLLLLLMAAPCSAAVEAVMVKTPPVGGRSGLYVFNRKPLEPNPLAKLPIGAIEPGGWLKGQLTLMASGMVGHLDEVSHYLSVDSGWLNPKNPGWEELPYWLKGFGDLGYVLKDAKIEKEAMRWLDAIMASQQPDGYFGPEANKKNRDVWPNMVVLYAVQSLYEATGDERVIPFMTKYFRWQNSLPMEDLLPESWQVIRGGDNLESVYWLYNRTGDEFLLELAEKIHRKTANWTEKIASFHGVNFAQGFREPAVFYQQSRDSRHLAAAKARQAEMLGEYGQVPGGLFGADENCRPGKTGPEQAAETCTMVEYMNSDESLLRITGETEWADHAEDVAFNSFPASYSPDWRGIHYLTAPNQIQLDRGGEHCYQNGGRLVSYSALETYRCCQHNVAQGWPYFAEHLWMATRDGGLAAVFYCANKVKARVAGGTEVTITEDTGYPFSDRIMLTISARREVEFPLYLRIPGWCSRAGVSVNGEQVRTQMDSGGYLRLHQKWHNHDIIEILLPMDIDVRMWEKQNNAVSVRRGPLWYSLKIGEKWVTYVEDEKFAKWPDAEVFPTSAWNYALILDQGEPARSFRVKKQSKPASQPFVTHSAPIALTARGRRLPSWEAVTNCPGPLPASPAQTAEPPEDITLIPMGAARLRISVFPVAAR